MARRLPPLNWLRTFETAARHLSFTRAAEELNVTQAAVSQQVKALEMRLGIPLFRRVHNRLFLTYAGQAWLPKLRAGFDLLASGTEELHIYDQGASLTVRLPSSFSIQWLVPRLDRFHAHYPTIDIRLIALGRAQEVDGAVIDLDIRNGTGDWAGLESTILMHENVFPVCSRQTATGDRPLREPRDLAGHELLHVSGYREDWRMWFETAGLEDFDASRGLQFDQSITAIQAAINGMGVVLGRSPLVAGELAAGRLVAPFDIELACEDAYWITAAPSLGKRPQIVAFRNWLMEEAAAE
ncbi:MAG: transcriptional regulator GcvA [Alphaproteobacteria bacterium]|nr:transcriptional regulator GcvA [Alphaproteobacteria bacterium]